MIHELLVSYCHCSEIHNYSLGSFSDLKFPQSFFQAFGDHSKDTHSNCYHRHLHVQLLFPPSGNIQVFVNLSTFFYFPQSKLTSLSVDEISLGLYFNDCFFFVLWYINLCGLFNTNSILVKGQNWSYITHTLVDKGVYTASKVISLKVNVIARLDFELTYDNTAVQLVIHCATRTYFYFQSVVCWNVKSTKWLLLFFIVN